MVDEPAYVPEQPSMIGETVQDQGSNRIENDGEDEAYATPDDESDKA